MQYGVIYRVQGVFRQRVSMRNRRSQRCMNRVRTERSVKTTLFDVHKVKIDPFQAWFCGFATPFGDGAALQRPRSWRKGQRSPDARRASNVYQ